jgi:hypothetical protein
MDRLREEVQEALAEVHRTGCQHQLKEHRKGCQHRQEEHIRSVEASPCQTASHTVTVEAAQREPEPVEVHRKGLIP